MASESGDLQELKDLDLGTSPMTQPEPDEPEVRIEEEQEAEQ